MILVELLNGLVIAQSSAADIDVLSYDIHLGA